MGYSFRLAARVLLYASSHRQDNTHHGLCYTSRGTLAGTRNSSMGIFYMHHSTDRITHTMAFVTPVVKHWLERDIAQWGFFYMHHPTDRITHTTAFVTPVVGHWLEREIAQWGFFYIHHSTDRITHTTAFVTHVVDHWLERG